MGLPRKPSRKQTRRRGPQRRSPSVRSAVEASKIRVVGAAKVAFEELAQGFVANGIPSQMAERLLRAAYVHETAKKVGRGWGQRPNLSHISVKTGLDRHLVKAILSNEPEALGIPKGRLDPLTKITDGWASDPEYSTARGPRDLVQGAKHSLGKSAYSLIETYAPGVSASLVIQELLEAGYVALLPNGRLRLTTRRVSLCVTTGIDESPSHARLRRALRAFLFPVVKR